MLSPEALEFHSHHPLFLRGQESVRRAMAVFLNKDGVGPRQQRVDQLGRLWTVDVQPYNGLVGLIRHKPSGDGLLELAAVTGINDQFHYVNKELKLTLRGEQAIERVEETLAFLIENSRKISQLGI